MPQVLSCASMGDEVNELEVDPSEYNGMMVTAALIATITFAGMVLPPGGLVSAAPSNTSNIVLTSSGTTQLQDDAAGHAVMSTGHYNLGTAMAACLFMSFTLSLCCLVLVMSVMGVADSRKRKRYCCTCPTCVADWRVTFVLCYITLNLAIMFVYAAFVCAAWMNFNMHLGSVRGLIGVTAVMLGLAILWLLLGPFSITRCCNRQYDVTIKQLDDKVVLY